jgi:hypothetical protein
LPPFSPDLQARPVLKANPVATGHPVRRGIRDLRDRKEPPARQGRAESPAQLGLRDRQGMRKLAPFLKGSPDLRVRQAPKARQVLPVPRDRRGLQAIRGRRGPRVYRGHAANPDRLDRQDRWDHPAPWERWGL